MFHSRSIHLTAPVVVAALLWSATAQAQAILVDYRGIYREKSPGVVFIAAMITQNQGNTGTGSVITNRGHVLTNAHVIWNAQTNKPADRVFIFLKPAKVTGNNQNDLQHQYTGRVLQYDNAMDLALLQIVNPPAQLTLIPFQDSNLVEIGAPTIAIGHPEQGVRWTMTTGAVSGMIENFNRVNGKNVFQMETSVNRGNSGGPLLDHKGNLIGVNSMIARQAADGLAITGINFAIQANAARAWLRQYGVQPEARAVAYEWQDPNAGQAQAQAAPPPPPQNPPPAAQPPPPQQQGQAVAVAPPPAGSGRSNPPAGSSSGSATNANAGTSQRGSPPPPPPPSGSAGRPGSGNNRGTATAQNGSGSNSRSGRNSRTGRNQPPPPPPPPAEPEYEEDDTGYAADDQQGGDNTLISNRQAIGVGEAPERRRDAPPARRRRYESAQEGVRPGQQYTETQIDKLRARMREVERETDEWINDVERQMDRVRNQPPPRRR